MNKVIEEGLQSNNSKPFWKYVKSKKQDNIGAAPLKQKGNLITDAKAKADILVEQFQSVFTKNDDHTKPKVNTKKPLPNIKRLTVLDSSVVECPLRVREVVGSIPGRVIPKT